MFKGHVNTKTCPFVRNSIGFQIGTTRLYRLILYDAVWSRKMLDLEFMVEILPKFQTPLLFTLKVMVFSILLSILVSIPVSVVRINRTPVYLKYLTYGCHLFAVSPAFLNCLLHTLFCQVCLKNSA